MTLHKPILMQPTGGDPDLAYSGAEMREVLTATYPWQGVIPSAPVSATPYKVAQRGAGANFSVDVPAGLAVIVGDDTANQLNYMCWSDSTFNLVTPGAPGSGTRTHRVVLQLRDKLNNGAWTTYDFIPVLVQDTGGGFPAEPASSLTIASVSIAAAQGSVTNANIGDLRANAAPVTVWKGGDTGRTSGSVVIDPDLQVIIGPGTWRWEADLGVNASTSTDLLFAMVGPSGATGAWGGVWHAAGDAWADGHGHNTYATSETDSVVTVSATNKYAKPSGIITTTNIAPLAVYWGVLNTGATVNLKAGSCLSVRRIG